MSLLDIGSMARHPKLRWALAGMVLLACIVLLAVATARRTTNSGKHSPAATARKQERAAELEYPEPGAVPTSLVSTHDESKDRSVLTLTLNGIPVSANGARLASATLTITSRFDGKERTRGELSVQCKLSLTSSEPGVLAPSSPPGSFVADGKALQARAAEAGHSGYTSSAKSDGSHESLDFHLSTRDILRIAAAKAVTAEFGRVRLTLTPTQVRDIRELAARMKPITANK